MKIALFLLLAPILYGQHIEGNPNARIRTSSYSATTIDQSHQQIYYDYWFVKNPRSGLKSHHQALLQIGESHTKFFDYFSLVRDSLVEKYSHFTHVKLAEYNLILGASSKIGLRFTVLNHVNENTFHIYNRIYSQSYMYPITVPEFKWSLTRDEQKQLLNYPVKKAVCHYRGRTWIAWYTEEIPINSGPYVFKNLPGLILELYDDQMHYHFLATAIELQSMPIYRRNDKNIVPTTESLYLKAERNFHEDPSSLIQTKTYSSPGVEVKLPPQSLPYNPIEMD